MTSITAELPPLRTGYAWDLFDSWDPLYGTTWGLRIVATSVHHVRVRTRVGIRPKGHVVTEAPPSRFLWWTWQNWIVERDFPETVAKVGPSTVTLSRLDVCASIALKEASARGHDAEAARGTR